jgi:hypothetical protein
VFCAFLCSWDDRHMPPPVPSHLRWNLMNFFFFGLGYHWTKILLISASWVAGIINLNCHLVGMRFELWAHAC